MYRELARYRLHIHNTPKKSTNFCQLAIDFARLKQVFEVIYVL